MNNIELDIISSDKFKNMKTIEKIKYIINEVKKNKIIVLEYGLEPIEETKLIEMTMMEISEKFIGIEIESYPKKQESNFLLKLLKRNNQRITIIGPANKLKMLKKEKDLISTIVYDN